MENEKYNFRNILRNFHADFHADAFVNGSGQIGRDPGTRQKKGRYPFERTVPFFLNGTVRGTSCRGPFIRGLNYKGLAAITRRFA